MTGPISYHQEISRALHEKLPLVALESMVITHGLPFPTNVDTASAMEATVRKSRAIPATAAIIQGQIFVGLTRDQLAYLGKQPAGSVRKCSRRDLAIAIARGEDGSTTVA